MRFSERYGYKKPRESFQIDSVDTQLRNALWNLLTVHVWENVHSSHGFRFLSDELNGPIRNLCRDIWIDHLGLPLDTLDDNWDRVYPKLREHFYACSWFEVYDFIQFVANTYTRYRFKEHFVTACNVVLEREASAYRFVGFEISRITEKEEVGAIESALELAPAAVKTHLSRALDFLSDRKNPDYRNSIKESISAVESLVIQVLGERGTLGQLLKKLEDQHVHPALRSAFSSLYGYTSDQDGVRHALLESDNVSFEEAKFFLVTCSAFVNYVNGKLLLSKKNPH